MRIRCAKCDRLVDEVETWREPRGLGTRIVVRCHGEVDQMVLSLRDADAIGRDGLRQMEEGEGVAFATPQLPRQARALNA